MKKLLFVSIGLLTALVLYRCNSSSSKEVNNTEAVDILHANLDTTIDPRKDFFTYANGSWLKKNPIPASESRWGIGNMVDDETNARLKKLSEDAASQKGAAKGSSSQLIGDFYFSGMDSVSIDKMGSEPIKEELQKINDIKDAGGIMEMVAMLQTYRVSPLFGMYSGQDAKNSDLMALQFTQGGLGLPNRDYYFNNDARTKKIREEYVSYMQRTFSLLGDGDKAEKNSKDVMKFEMSLASASRKLEDLRDPRKNYNKMSVSDMDKLCPSVKWAGFFAMTGAGKVDSVIIGQPEFFIAVDKNLKSVPVETWKNYLRWQLTATYSDKLGGEFEKEQFHFYGTILRGEQKQKVRWKRVMDEENALIGEMLGQLFVKEFFPVEAKKRYEDMVDAVVASYEEHIKGLDWMSAPTKEKALLKLHAIKKKVGYPDHWKDFSAMDISRQPYVRNCINANKWWWNYDMNKLGKPVDRTEWDMTPQEYNAYYDASNNEIVLPAAIFSIPGIKDIDADDAMVYGYAGASTIGHELTHGFDDEGRQSDEKGNLKDWWTKEDADKFDAKTQLYIRQFSNYKVLDSMHVNGKATLGENIADLGGIVIALDAFKKTEQYKKGEKIGGLTPMQRYFLGYALGWQLQQRDERLANQILTDVHAPANLRVNGPFANVPSFYEAFNVKEGDPMWRADSVRVKIW